MFAVKCMDKTGGLMLRMEYRPAHLAFLEEQGAKVVMAGPILDDDHQSPIGSLLVLDITDRAELSEFLAQDPYAQAGLFQQVEVLPYRKVLPK